MVDPGIPRGVTNFRGAILLFVIIFAENCMKTRQHSSRMRTYVGGGGLCPGESPGQRSPCEKRLSLTETPWTEIPRQRPPGRNIGPGPETPLPERPRDQAAIQEVTAYRDPPVNGKMIISLSMNITMNQLGGASVIAIFHSLRHNSGLYPNSIDSVYSRESICMISMYFNGTRLGMFSIEGAFRV